MEDKKISKIFKKVTANGSHSCFVSFDNGESVFFHKRANGHIFRWIWCAPKEEGKQLESVEGICHIQISSLQSDTIPPVIEEAFLKILSK